MELFKVNKKEWRAWIDTRPEIIKQLSKRFSPNKLYKLNSNNVYIYAYNEYNLLKSSVDIFNRKNKP